MKNASPLRVLATRTDRRSAHWDGTACWVWTGFRERSGYGRFTCAGVRKLAHRWSYELLVGPVPEGLQLDHLCRNRSCVNPAHLEPVTGRTNILRGECDAADNARKTHCKRGHLLAGNNIYWRSGNRRECATCRRAYIAKMCAKRKAERRSA